MQLKKNLDNTLKKAMPKLSKIAQQFYKDRIRNGVDVDGKPFKKSKSKGRALKRDGKLIDSIKVQSVGANGFKVKAMADYAEIHNKGGEVTVTEKMKRFFWAKYFEAGGAQKGDRRGEASEGGDNTEASMYKALALMKVGDKISIPKRQFIGESSKLQKLLERELQSLLNNI